MTILSFVTQEELDNLNEDPKIAFMELVNHAQRRLSDQTANFDPDNSYEWTKKKELEKSFMNVIVASGKRFGIDPFSTMTIPRKGDFRDDVYEQFKSDLDHYVTQIVIDNSIRARTLSVEITQSSKDKIRAYVYSLREALQNGNMPSNKRNALLAKLDEFEVELEKRRTSFISLAVLAITFVGAPGAASESVDVTNRLVTKITQVFAEAKQAEEQTRSINQGTVPQQLSPPRLSERESYLDDGIPF